MHMHATTGDGMRHKILIRKLNFMAQFRRGAGFREHFP